MGSGSWLTPWVQMKYFSYHPVVYPNMISAMSVDAHQLTGEMTHVYDKEGQHFGMGFFNPKAKVPLRVLQHGDAELTEEALDARLASAIALRTQVLKLDAFTNAYRVVNSAGDGLPGLMVDRYADTLSIEVSNLAAWRRLRRWLKQLHAALGTTQHVIEVDPELARVEGMRAADVPEYDDPRPETVRITEHGLRYVVNFADGHKTGFFCDQRENRLRWGQWTKGCQSVLDLCSYTGGFSLAAKLIGGCEEVQAVDLDEKAIEQARVNANLNQTRLSLTHADVFPWGRQMGLNGKLYDAVVLDPPKLLHTRDDEEEGRKARNKYYDLNSVAMQLVKPGGLFLSCSCSGLLDVAEFEEIVMRSAHRNKRKLQILDRTGAGPDHPVMSNCPESRYLKAVWAIVK
jgi:23S rRNA (cytosine1962-C5)-methyltransferase